MPIEMMNFIETVLNGLMAGVLYSLVALGFVLIFKASGIFNFAQGVFALFAALTMVGFLRGDVPFAPLLHEMFGGDVLRGQPLEEVVGSFWLAVVIATMFTAEVMTGLAFMVVRIVLKPLVNQEPIILFMATIGLAFVLEGVGDLMWGSNVKPLDVGLPTGLSETIETWSLTVAEDGYFGMYIDRLDLSAAIVAGSLVAALAAFFQYTKTGRALRAVADDHQAALSVGISLTTIWIIVWAVAGYVALVAGVVWGTKSGVQFSLSLIALKALPVLILGGFTSVPGAIVGGLLIGVGEKLAEIYTGGFMNSLFGFDANYFKAMETWFAYVVALIFLLFRPQGLFGEKIIERV